MAKYDMEVRYHQGERGDMELEERKGAAVHNDVAEAGRKKSQHVDEWKTRNLKRHQKSKAERKIMWKGGEIKETAPKARREELYVKKKTTKLVSHRFSMRTKICLSILFHSC